MDKKRIKILTQGPIRVKGFINGPVLTPYFEELSTIFSMLSAGINIVEVCDDGREVKLTAANFSEDHNKPVVKTKVENVQKEEVIPVVEQEVTETKEETIEPTDEKVEVVDEIHINETIETVEEASTEENIDTEKKFNKPNNYNNHKKNHRK